LRPADVTLAASPAWAAPICAIWAHHSAGRPSVTG